MSRKHFHLSDHILKLIFLPPLFLPEICFIFCRQVPKCHQQSLLDAPNIINYDLNTVCFTEYDKSHFQSYHCKNKINPSICVMIISAKLNHRKCALVFKMKFENLSHHFEMSCKNISQDSKDW